MRRRDFVAWPLAVAALALVGCGSARTAAALPAAEPVPPAAPLTLGLDPAPPGCPVCKPEHLRDPSEKEWR